MKVTGGKAAEFGETYTIKSSYLVSAVGQLNTPRWPDIPGKEDFKGTKMHSARWNWNKPIAGLKVGIIGNGATAAQIIPEVAKTVGKLSVFQRTPNWVVPRAVSRPQFTCRIHFFCVFPWECRLPRDTESKWRRSGQDANEYAGSDDQLHEESCIPIHSLHSTKIPS